MSDPAEGEPWAVDDLHVRLFVARSVELAVGAWRAANVQDSFWRLYRNDRAGAWLELASGAFPLEPGRLYFVPAGTRFSCANSAAVGHLYVHFDLLGLPRAALRALFEGPCAVPAGQALDRAAQDLARDLAAGRLAGLAQRCRAKELLYGALAAYLAAAPDEQMERYRRLTAAYAPVRAALQEIEQALPERLTNRDLARRCHMSEDHFIRRFRECVGQSPAQYIQEQRVLRAAQRLVFTADSIEVVAAAAGFANRFYFSRVFVRHMGVSPAAYRRAARV
jgi:AraC-like DNA-binding protein